MNPHRRLRALLMAACVVALAGCQSAQQLDHSSKTNSPMKERQYYELTPEQRDQKYQRELNQNSNEGYRLK